LTHHLYPYLILGVLGPLDSATKGILISSAVFAQLTVVTNTHTHIDTHTHHTTYDVCNSPHLCT